MNLWAKLEAQDDLSSLDRTIHGLRKIIATLKVILTGQGKRKLEFQLKIAWFGGFEFPQSFPDELIG